MLEEAWAWGFDVSAWRAHLGALTWPEARPGPAPGMLLRACGAVRSAPRRRACARLCPVYADGRGREQACQARNCGARPHRPAAPLEGLFLGGLTADGPCGRLSGAGPALRVPVRVGACTDAAAPARAGAAPGGYRGGPGPRAARAGAAQPPAAAQAGRAGRRRRGRARRARRRPAPAPAGALCARHRQGRRLAGAAPAPAPPAPCGALRERRRRTPVLHGVSGRRTARRQALRVARAGAGAGGGALPGAPRRAARAAARPGPARRPDPGPRGGPTRAHPPVPAQVLAEAGAEGLPVGAIAERVQTLGLRDMRTSKAPKASVVAALSADAVFARVAPGTYALQSLAARVAPAAGGGAGAAAAAGGARARASLGAHERAVAEPGALVGAPGAPARSPGSSEDTESDDGARGGCGDEGELSGAEDEEEEEAARAAADAPPGDVRVTRVPCSGQGRRTPDRACLGWALAVLPASVSPISGEQRLEAGPILHAGSSNAVLGQLVLPPCLLRMGCAGA